MFWSIFVSLWSLYGPVMIKEPAFQLETCWRRRGFVVHPIHDTVNEEFSKELLVETQRIYPSDLLPCFGCCYSGCDLLLSLSVWNNEWAQTSMRFWSWSTLLTCGKFQPSGKRASASSLSTFSFLSRHEWQVEYAHHYDLHRSDGLPVEVRCHLAWLLLWPLLHSLIRLWLGLSRMTALCTKEKRRMGLVFPQKDQINSCFRDILCDSNPVWIKQLCFPFYKPL